MSGGFDVFWRRQELVVEKRRRRVFHLDALPLGRIADGDSGQRGCDSLGLVRVAARRGRERDEELKILRELLFSLSRIKGTDMNHYLIMGTTGVREFGGNTHSSSSCMYILIQSLQVLKDSRLHTHGYKANLQRVALAVYEKNKNRNVIKEGLWCIYVLDCLSLGIRRFHDILERPVSR